MASGEKRPSTFIFVVFFYAFLLKKKFHLFLQKIITLSYRYSRQIINFKLFIEEINTWSKFKLLLY